MTSCVDYDQRIEKSIAPFSSYCDEIESIIYELQHIGWKGLSSNRVTTILNGKTICELQRLVPVVTRKEAGMFFTNNILADKVAEKIAPFLRSGIKIIDPACGAGNLLLSCAKHLPPCKSLDETLSLWSNVIIGYDLYPEFIRAARLRLLLLACSMHPDDNHNIHNHKEIFGDVRAGNILSNLPTPDGTCIVVNPPFGHIPSPEGCQWASGKIQVAGWFVERLIRMAHAGQHIVAILPDVLRSGTRYKRWRELISSLCSTLTIEPAGRFDVNTDVDVFLLHAVAKANYNESTSWPIDSSANCDSDFQLLSDFFDIHVGAVVPHRDLVEGKSYPYINARTASPWKILNNISHERRSTRTVFPPPFVVVRRTSSPSDKHRCIATVINEERKVAVENHLIVLTPKDKSLETCKYLLDILRSPETNKWLNQRIRCRHLTVCALQELPYSPKYQLFHSGDKNAS